MQYFTVQFIYTHNSQYRFLCKFTAKRPKNTRHSNCNGYFFLLNKAYSAAYNNYRLYVTDLEHLGLFCC